MTQPPDTQPRRIHDLVAIAGARYPDRPAVSSENGAALRYAGLLDEIAACAADLQDAGLRPGDRLLILAENAPALPILLMAASRLGAIAIPVNARMTVSEISRIADHADPRLTVYLSAVSPAARDHASTANAAPVALAGAAMHCGHARETRPEKVENGPEMTAVILYTTGTTGLPKGVMLSHGNLAFGGLSSARLRGIGPEDVIYGVLPLTHVFGLTSMLCAGLFSGAHVRLAPRFAAPAVLDALAAGVTVLPAVPQMHATIMAEAAHRGCDRLSAQLRYVSSGAAPLDLSWKRRAEAFYGIALQNGYGMTETTAGVTITNNAPGDPDISVGYPLPQVEIALDESVGREAGTGEVLTRGPHVMRGYFRDPQATAAVLDRQGWLRTGDLGRLDQQGRLHIVGRCKELIIRGGFNIYPPEVEAALNDHPAVLQSAVIGVPRVGGDEEILAFCQPIRPGAVTAEELAAHVAGLLSAYKRPTRIVLTGPFPAAATGKVLKHKLMTHFADLLAEPVPPAARADDGG